MSNVAIIIVMLFKSLRHQLLFMLFVLRKCHKCALHFASTKLQRTLSLMRALCGRMKMPPWLKTLSTGAEVAGTQYMEDTN